MGRREIVRCGCFRFAREMVLDFVLLPFTDMMIDKVHLFMKRPALRSFPTLSAMFVLRVKPEMYSVDERWVRISFSYDFFGAIFLGPEAVLELVLGAGERG